MWRIVMMVTRLFLKAPYYFCRIWHYSKSNKPFDERFFYIKKVTKAANKAGRVNIETYGEENIPKENGFVFFPNHQGLFDVLVFLDVCPVPFSFVMKKEVRNTILLKQVADAIDALAIDREDIRQSMTVIQTMAEEVKKGRNYIIFPEGTRSKNHNKLINFKGGSFKSAVKAKAPIVPCALIDTYKVFDDKSIKPVTVKLVYLTPMYYEEYKGMKTTEIAEEVKARIEAAIDEYQNK